MNFFQAVQFYRRVVLPFVVWKCKCTFLYTMLPRHGKGVWRNPGFDRLSCWKVFWELSKENFWNYTDKGLPSTDWSFYPETI